MCVVPEHTNSVSSTASAVENKPNTKDMSQLTFNENYSFLCLLELAANNDFEGFKLLVERDTASVINEVGIWYGRKKGSKQIVLDHRTPLMVAATYGSIDVLKFILSQPEVDVNLSCGPDKSTALHCAASGGSINACDVVKLLLSSGADPNFMDSCGLRPFDVVIAPPKLSGMRVTLEELLMTSLSDVSVCDHNLRVSITASNSNSPTLSSSPGNGSPLSPSDSFYPLTSKYIELSDNSVSEKKEYPIDPSLPDIKNSIYSTDEFRMFSFKVRPCSRAYSHDWTECPFVHPGENARRRDPRKYHYSCVPCPDFRKGACRRGDMCEYAHGVFESWLHPAQYRTRLCKDGTGCARRVCFFAHTPDELRPLYVSTGSAVPSPRSNTSAMDMLSLLPGSPSSVIPPSPFNQQPMSPSATGISHSSLTWPQPNVPTLNLPGSNLQSSRLRSSLCARDIALEELNMLPDFDTQQQQQHLLNDLASFAQNRSNSASFNRACLSKSLTPSNLDDLFSAEINSSPRYSDQAGVACGVFSPSHKSALLSQFQQQQQSMLSPINTNNIFSPKNVEHPLLQASFGVSSPRCMSPRSLEPISPMSNRLSAFAQPQQQLRCHSSRDLGYNPNSISAVGSPGKQSWGSPNGNVDWSVKGSELDRLRRSSSFELNSIGDEPDLSWVQSLVKESSPAEKEKIAGSLLPSIVSNGEAVKLLSSQVESVDHSVLAAWLEQMQLDQLVA